MVESRGEGSCRERFAVAKLPFSAQADPECVTVAKVPFLGVAVGCILPYRHTSAARQLGQATGHRRQRARQLFYGLPKATCQATLGMYVTSLRAAGRRPHTYCSLLTSIFTAFGLPFLSM